MKSVIFDSKKKRKRKHLKLNTGMAIQEGKNKKRHTNNLNCNNIVIEKRELEKAK